ncbi:hypothetical protein Aple_021920 [Acrocarpospora pleiomorpha]|uniref:Uncharacterized protein n=1 Tax=Acrocarpospora pleiomorpha TaxID=90975 RepID=A0A5M3XF64_9ACTN|nr:hypothetical protein Aple_021920 [Acrocarpospora pleiomorpha]
MPRPFGYLGGRDARVEPGGDARMPQVVRTLGQLRTSLVSKGVFPGFRPRSAVGDSGEFPATYAPEESAV